MKITARAATVMALIFAVLCLAFGLNGLTSLEGIVEPTQLRDAKGFAWFWIFLGGVGVVFGILSWWIARSMKDGE